LHLSLPGRLQILPGQPSIILDVAHNPHAAAALEQNLANMGHFSHTHAVVGMLHDNNIKETLMRLLPRVDRWFCASLEGERGTDAHELQSMLNALYARPPEPEAIEDRDPPSDASQARKKPGVRPAVRAA